MDGLAAWVSQLQFGRLTELLVTAAAAVLCICFHETCHGLAALMLGDPTAKRMGRLSLNPLKHIDPVGLVMLVVAKFGWAKPVPIDVRYFRNPRAGMAITALAGPLSNVFLSALAAAGYAASVYYAWSLDAPALSYLGEFFFLVFHLSAGLAVFNLLPVQRLDGGVILSDLIISHLGPIRGSQICKKVSLVCTVFLWMCAAAVQIRCGGNLSVFLISVYLLTKIAEK